MKLGLQTVLLVAGLFCFGIDVVLGLFSGSSGKLRLVSLGLFFWILAVIVG